MKMTTSQCVSALLMTTVLAGCQMMPLRNQAATNAKPEAPLSASAEWAQVAERDREHVRLGQLPPEVISYDQQIAQMIPEGDGIAATRDKAKAQVWSNKFNALITARNQAIGRVAARQMARSNATANAWAGAKPDPCLSPMGKNICTTQPAQQGRVNYSVGPGGIGATVGGLFVGPGGISAGNGQ
ncbi:hypothetical protein [Rhodanobacter sp. L36]|uniref:hypothetical protein n=1 Tax=Rhodanobacter sp. L36 TaxID=1747221 RepID=UPI00131C23D6|nr:hypothetical protein [Rhodanobacter sp. L36]